jgi:trigger factor
VKVTTEKLPKSLLALDIELEPNQVEKGLDRAARRLSQKYTVPGFRKGKAPRFIIENYFGREALMEEASEDLINRAFKDALKQEQIEPIGPASLETVDPSAQFRFRVTVPISPTVTLPDYREFRLPLETEPVTDEMVDRAMEMLRDKHVVLKELEEPRPAQKGDQLTVQLETLVDGEPLEERAEDAEIPETTLVLEPDRLVDELYAELVGSNVDEERMITAQMPEDHANEQVRGKEVVFNVKVLGIQERLLTEWEEVPTLEEFDGTVEDLRRKTRTDMETSSRQMAERQLVDGFLEQLTEQTSYDIPDVMIRETAHEMLHEQERQFAQYGITLDQMLQYRGQTHDEATEELLPQAEQQLKVRLALQQVVRTEQFDITNEEIENEIQQIVQDYAEEERENAGRVLATQLRSTVANAVLDRKLRGRLMEIAQGEAPPLPDSEAPTEEPTAEEAAPTAEENIAARADDEQATPDAAETPRPQEHGAI